MLRNSYKLTFLKYTLMIKLPGYRLETYEEAELIIHAVRFKFLELTNKRFTEEESRNLSGGEILCFTENVIKRWTDGHNWSTSQAQRIKDKSNSVKHFLIYIEKPKKLYRSESFKYSNDKINANKLNENFRLSKKTITLAYNNVKYHIVTYSKMQCYHQPLLNSPLFATINNVINNYPDLLNDDFLKKELELGDQFYVKYDFQPIVYRNTGKGIVINTDDNNYVYKKVKKSTSTKNKKNNNSSGSASSLENNTKSDRSSSESSESSEFKNLHLSDTDSDFERDSVLRAINNLVFFQKGNTK